MRLARNPFMVPATPKLVRPNPRRRRRNPGNGWFNGRLSGPLTAALVVGSVGEMYRSSKGLSQSAVDEKVRTADAGMIYGFGAGSALLWTVLGAWIQNTTTAAAGGIAWSNLFRLAVTRNSAAGSGWIVPYQAP